MARLVLVYATLLLLVSAICWDSGFAQNPGQLVARALSCFNANNIYNRCNRAYRLTQSGYINIPDTATDQFCYGPCLSETHLVLDCIDRSLSTFVFYNRATTDNIRTMLRAACGHSRERGHFNVEEYMQEYLQDEYEWDSAKIPLPPNKFFSLLLAASLLLLTVRVVL